MPKTIQSAAQARAADSSCIQDGVPSLVLMEKAAAAVADFILAHPAWQIIKFLCGPGNNGADGLAAARLLQEKGRMAFCYIPEGKTSAEFSVQLKAAQSAGVITFSYSVLLVQDDEIHDVLEGTDVIVDALFGSGLSRPLSGDFAKLIELANASLIPTIALDLPSGLNGSSGKALGTAIKADYTLSLDGLKEGQIRNDGPDRCGEVISCDIGIADRYHTSNFYVLDQEYARTLIHHRPLQGHKGTFGKVLLTGGSLPMQGALNMAALSAFHAGCGLLTLYTPQSAAMAIASKNDLAMILSAPETNGFFALDACATIPDLVKNYDVYGVGNGMGKGKGARLVVEALLKSDAPVLVDADGLNCLAAGKLSLLNRKAPTILTPHIMEFVRISGIPKEEVLQDPIDCARKFLDTYPNVVLVLKGAQTLVASNRRMAWLSHPNSALAKGGSGDVLAGLITGLWAWHKDPFDAAALGVYIHNAASFVNADINPACFTPHDLIRGFNAVFNDLEA